MEEYAKIKLWEVCFHKPLFRKELESLVSRTQKREIFEVLKYCYDKYSDMHADVLLEVFSNHINNRKGETVLTESDEETVKLWN